MKKVSLRQVSVLIAVIATLVVNTLAATLPLNGLSTGEISDRFQVYFVPAGYVFSIWGVIYLGLIAYSLYQIRPSQKENEPLQAIGWLFVASSLANIVWLFLWHYEQFTWTIFAMLALLMLLILIYERLWQARIQGVGISYPFVQLPFSIYLGWITVATVANATSLLDFIGWSGWGLSDITWAMVMLGIASIIGIAVILRRRDPAYGLVLVWAFVGIARKHTGTDPVANTAWVSAGIILLFLLYQIFRSRRNAL